MLYNSLKIEDTIGMKVGIYNRCSTQEESQKNALELQAKQSREIAIAHKWDIAEQYVESVSGTSKRNRTEYIRLLEDMQTDKFDIVLIKSLDRLMRSNKDWYEFLDILCKNKKHLYIYMDNKFFDTSQHGFMAGIEMAMHSQFSRVLSDKLKNSHRWRQEHKSGYNITKDIYGWTKLSKDVYEINEEQAFYIKSAVEMIRQGYGFHSIAKKLYELGARSSVGKEIHASVWKNILTSTRLYGCVVLNKTQNNFDTKLREYIPPEEWVYCDGALPPIIDKQTWEEVQTIIESRKKSDDRTSNWSRYPLSNKIVCGCCGSPYHRAKSPRRQSNLSSIEQTETDDKHCDYVPIYKCRSAYRFGRSDHSLSCTNQNVSEDKLMCLLEETSEKYFSNIFSDNESIINRSLELVKRMLDEKDSGRQLEKLKKELEKQNKKKDVLFGKLMDQVIDDNDFKKYTEKINDEIKDLEYRIKVIETDTSSLLENERRLERIRDTLKTSDIIKKAKGNALLNYIDLIVVNKDSTITIKFNKYKLLGLLTLINVSELDSKDDEEFYSVTVYYEGYQSLKERTSSEKKELIDIIKQYPSLSYSGYAEKMHITKNHIAARIRDLIKYGYIKRAEDNSLIVIKDYE